MPNLNLIFLPRSFQAQELPNLGGNWGIYLDLGKPNMAQIGTQSTFLHG